MLRTAAIFVAFTMGLSVALAAQAATNTIQVYPNNVPDENWPRVNPGDAPTGFGPDSWQGPAAGKSNYHVRYLADGDKLSALFPADAATLTINDLASISYFTKRPAGTPAGRDWWITIYTRLTGSGDASSWYHAKFTNNYGSHTETDAWTQYSTASTMTFNGMTLAALQSSAGGQLIEAITIQTDSGWNGFDGYVDGLEITLMNGNVGQVNFETDSTTIDVAPCEVPDEQPPRINAADAPLGFGPDSWQGPASGKSNWHAAYLAGGDKLTALFPAEAATLKIADLAAISYFTKRPAATPAGRDWWVMIYTRPTGSGDAASWYHDRFINNYSDHAETGAWTLYSTERDMTFHSNALGGPVMTLADLITAHGGDLIGAISIQTDSGWNGFDGFVDGLEITLTNGKVGRVNLGSALTSDDRYVDAAGSDASNTCLTSGSPCATIQHAIDVACTPSTVHVAAGTYQENVVVTKGVELSGAGQGNSIIEPAVSNANPCTGSSLCGGTASNIVLVQASNVTIHDFTLDGDNPGLTSGIVRNGADVDARNGVITNYGVGDFQNLEVYNLTVQNIYLRGIYGAYNSSGTFNFHNNIVDNVMGDYYSIAIFGFLGGGTVANNTVSNANDAIAANWSHGTQFLDNVVTNSASGVHTDNSAGSGGSGDLIQGNQVSNCAPDGFGIWTFVPYVAPQVTGNTVTNCAVGLAAAGQGSVTFTDNTVDGSGAAGSVGAYVTTSQFGYGIGDVNASFTGNLLSNNDQGFFVQDKVCSANSTTGCQLDSDCPNYATGETCLIGSTATVNATCNRIADNTTDGILTEALDNPSVVVFNSNSITGNTPGADASAVPAGSINAQGNWWGCVAGPGNPGCDSVTAGVDYSSFTTSVPACVSCNADSDCSDGLACTGSDSCNLSTHMCQTGMPVDCSSLTNECSTGICVEPTGTCVADLSPDGSLCVNGGGTCQSGVCTSVYSLTLNYARLRRDSSIRRDNGVASVKGLVNDNDTGGELANDLVNGFVSVEIKDDGNFDVTVPLSSCAVNHYGTVRCRDRATRISARFRAWRVKGPLLYRMTLRQGALPDTVTGMAQPTGPVTVTLHQGSVDRTDVIGDIDACVAAGQHALRCRER